MTSEKIFGGKWTGDENCIYLWRKQTFLFNYIIFEEIGQWKKTLSYVWKKMIPPLILRSIYRF